MFLLSTWSIFGWMGNGGQDFLTINTLLLEQSFMVKSRWEGGGWPMCQPQFKDKELGSWIGMDLGSNLGTFWDRGLGLGLGLDNYDLPSGRED